MLYGMLVTMFVTAVSFIAMSEASGKTDALNVLGAALESCSYYPLTGYWRDGFCRTANEDRGTHVVCAAVTQEFLTLTKSKGNDLTRPSPGSRFPGLKAGDKWCLCAMRWLEAEKAGAAPQIVLASTDVKALQYTTIDVLKKYAVGNKDDDSEIEKEIEKSK